MEFTWLTIRGGMKPWLGRCQVLLGVVSDSTVGRCRTLSDTVELLSCKGLKLLQVSVPSTGPDSENQQAVANCW